MLLFCGTIVALMALLSSGVSFFLLLEVFLLVVAVSIFCAVFKLDGAKVRNNPDIPAKDADIFCLRSMGV